MWSIAGTANLSKELIRSGFWGASLDKLYLEEDHDMLSLKGIKLFITTLLASRFGALHWFGACCSSFALLCQSLTPSRHAILMFTPTYMGQYGGFSQKPLQLWHKPSTFEGLARSRPSFALQTLASRDHEDTLQEKRTS